jgi:hypothetical protein
VAAIKAVILSLSFFLSLLAFYFLFFFSFFLSEALTVQPNRRQEEMDWTFYVGTFITKIWGFHLTTTIPGLSLPPALCYIWIDKAGIFINCPRVLKFWVWLLIEGDFSQTCANTFLLMTSPVRVQALDALARCLYLILNIDK